MRWLISVCAGVAVLWCLWWAGASIWLVRGTAAWFADRRAEGWQAELADVNPGGFPMRVEAHLDTPELADPETGLAVRLDALTLSARTIWPGDVAVLLPETPIEVATPQDRWLLLADAARADMNLHPRAALELENMSLSSGPFRVEQAGGVGLFGGEALVLALTQTDPAERYDMRFDIAAFAPGDAPRAALRLPDDWPLIFDSLRAEAAVTFDTPIDRSTLEDRRPQPVAVDLRRIEAQWGDMRFLATDQVVRDAGSRAEGAVTVKAENWQRMLDIAQNAGLLPAEFRPQIEGMLRGLASGTGSTNDLDVTLRFEGGTTWIGFIPLGPAPSLVIR